METNEGSNETLVASGEVCSENDVVVKVVESDVKTDVGGEVERGFDDKGFKFCGEKIGTDNDSEAVDLKEDVDGSVGRGGDIKDKGLKRNVLKTRSAKKEVQESDDMERNGEENESDESDEDDDDVGDQSCEYRVGDFVWGKIKSYPWWPGQIYDASDASEYALKLKQKNRFLVAYFGDGSFSWCRPSQLKPFVENYKVMSEQSNSKNFVYAIEAALDEVSTIVELEMTCSCVGEGVKPKAGMACNSGIKEGVLVPVEGVGKSFIAQCEPEKLIESLRDFAETVSLKNMLELTVLKSWLTAYYRAKGGYSLPSYYYPRTIEGLEDKSGIEVLVQGPDGEEWFSAPVMAVGSGLTPANQSLLQKCQETSADILYQRRKQKSVAELIEDEMKKENFLNESIPDAVTTGKRKREDDNEAEKQDDTRSALESGPRRGRRPKAATSRSPRTVGENITTGVSNDVGGNESDEPPTSGQLQNKILSGGESEAEEEGTKSNRLRERKRSKYLSPPFTNPSQITRISSFKKGSETESVKDSRVGERMTKIAGQLIGFQNTSNGTFQADVPAESGIDNSKSGIRDRNGADVMMQFTANPVQLLSQLQSIAADPLCLIEKSEVKFITQNIVTLRNPNFRNILNEVQLKGEIDSKKGNLDHVSQQVSDKSQDLETPPAKEAANACQTMINSEDGKKTAAVALILTFPPAYSLPSRNELMEIYGKFGPMNDKETDVFCNSFCARVSYLRISDGEQAYKASVEKNPFGTANVNYRLRYLSVTTKASESNQKSSMDNATVAEPFDDEAAQVGFIKEKLKMLTSMLESCDGKISVEFKSNLETEIKVLLDKVSLMTVTMS